MTDRPEHDASKGVELGYLPSRLLGVTCGWLGIAVVIAALAMTGCSDPNTQKRGEVTGTVTLDGQPVEDAAISFFPVGSTSGPSAGGKIVNGKYLVPQAQGPVIGDNRVEFNGAKKTGKKIKDRFGDEMTQDQIVPLFPDKYNIQSKEQVRIEAGQNTHNFDLKSK